MPSGTPIPPENTGRTLSLLSVNTFLVRDFGVSPLWLLTGQGDFYSKK